MLSEPGAANSVLCHHDKQADANPRHCRQVQLAAQNALHLMIDVV
jgi:hypothetical protein